MLVSCTFFFFQAEDGIRDGHVTGVQTCALPISGLARVFQPRGWSLYGKTRASPGCAGIVRERLPKDGGRYREAGSGMREFLRLLSAGVGCRGGLAWAHNPKVAGSNPAPATMNDEGLADAEAASPFRLPRLHPGIGMSAWLRRAAGKRRPRR